VRFLRNRCFVAKGCPPSSVEVKDTSPSNKRLQAGCSPTAKVDGNFGIFLRKAFQAR